MDKAKALQSQIDQEQQKKCQLQNDLSGQLNELTQLRSRESQLLKEINQLKDTKKLIELDFSKLKRKYSMDQLQMKELQDQLEAEQYFSTLYKSQMQDLSEDLEEKQRSFQDLEDEKSSLLHQLHIAIGRADSEALARSIAEETIADLEKEKTMKDLEFKDMRLKHQNEISVKEAALGSLRDKEIEYRKSSEKLFKENKQLIEQIQRQETDFSAKQNNSKEENDRLNSKLKTESLLKQQAVNKLHEIMNRKDINVALKGEFYRILQIQCQFSILTLIFDNNRFSKL